MRLGWLRSGLRTTGSAAGPVVIVTGASSGIGRALALRLGAAGYRVGLIARRRDPLEAAAAAIAAAGGIGRGRGCRRRRPRRLRAAIAEVEPGSARRICWSPTPDSVRRPGSTRSTPRMSRRPSGSTSWVSSTRSRPSCRACWRAERALARGLQPGRLQGTARRVGVLCQQGGRQRVHGGPSDRAAAPRRRGDDRLPGFRRHGDDADGLGDPLPDVGRRGGPPHRPADRPATGGVVRFPLPMALLTDLIARLPDALVARSGQRGRAPAPRRRPGPADPERVTDDRPGPQDAARRQGTLRGHGAGGRVRRRAGAGPGGTLLRAAGKRQHHHRPARRRPLGDGAEHAECRLRQPVPRDLRPARPLGAGRGVGRQPDRLVRDRGAADRGEGVGGLLRLEGLHGLAFSLEHRVGRSRPISAAADT